MGHHLESCAHCAAELQTLRQVVTAARDVAHEPLRIAPTPRLWAQIAAATGVEAVPRPAEVHRHTALASDDARMLDALAQVPWPATSSPPAPREKNWRRPDRPMLLLAAACLVLGLLGGGIGGWALTGRSTAPPASQVVAATNLAGLSLAPGAVGQADVVQTATGRQLDLDVQKLGIPDGFYEVWLIDPTVTKMVPIGVLIDGKGRFSLPDGVSLSSYPVVDISIQPLNGNPKHSGRSVLRGILKS